MQVARPFYPDEPLYLRIKPKYFSGAAPNWNDITVNHIRFPNFSVNRGEYSQPEDVLKPKWLDCGIAKFLVRDVPERVVEDQSCTFGVEHLPEKEDKARDIEENYAHSEVRAYKNGKFGEEPNRAARLKFRAILRNRMVILQLPT